MESEGQGKGEGEVKDEGEGEGEAEGEDEGDGEDEGEGEGGGRGAGGGGGRGGARPRGQPVQPVHLLHAIGGLERLWRRVAAAEDLVLFAQLRHEERGARTAERVRRGCGERVQRVQRRCRACADLGRETAPKQPASETPKRYWK